MFIVSFSFVIQFSRCFSLLRIFLISFPFSYLYTSDIYLILFIYLTYLIYLIYLIYYRLPRVGGDKGVRTLDPLRARQVLSQLSYIPIFITNIV